MTQEEKNLEQIEYLLHQSMQGIHFMFDKPSIVKVHKQAPTESEEFFSFSNMERVQDMLTKFIEKPTIFDKQRYLESLSKEDYELLIRAYFQLVENTILANSDLRH